VNQYRLSVAPEAEIDIAEGYCWYEDQAQLGGAFITAVEERLDYLLTQPFSCALLAHGIRRAVVQRFPYNIYYTVTDECLEILAVWQGRRNQAHWLELRRSTLPN